MLENIPTTISEVKNSLENKVFTVEQLVEHYFATINAKNPSLNAVLETFQDAKDIAKISDEKYLDGTARLLEGIPFLIKDCILYKGHISSSGSKMLEKYVAPYSSTIVKLLTDEGAIVLGRTNMDEFALGGSGENSAYGPTKNPFDLDRVPGGTSSGSASALASGMCLFALGTDTGGSVRQPASFCGLYGYKPSYGGFSRFGLIAAASSLEGPGIFTNSIDDLATIKKIIYKQDLQDGTTIPDDLRDKLSVTPYKKIVAYPKNYIESEGIDDEVKKDFYNSLSELEKTGYEIKVIDLKTLDFGLSAYYIVNMAEVSTNLSRMDGLRFGGGDVGEIKNYQQLFSKNRGHFFGSETKRRIIMGSFVLSHGYYDAYYSRAGQVRDEMRIEFASAFLDASIILMPTAPTTAFKLGEVKDPVTLYLEDIFTVPANLTGIPGLNIPTEKNSIGLPFGLQALSAYGCDDHLIEFAKDLKQLKTRRKTK